MNRNTRAAAVLLGLAVSIATSQAMPQLTGETSLLDVQLDAHTPVVPLQLDIHTSGRVRAADITQLDIDVLGENAAQQSAVLSLYMLEEAWTGALPPGAEPVDQLNLRGAVGEQPGAIDGTLYTSVDGAPSHHLVLVLEGEAELQVDLGLRAIATYGSELPKGRITLEVHRVGEVER